MPPLNHASCMSSDTSSHPITSSNHQPIPAGSSYEVPLSHLPANPDPLVYPLSIRHETVHVPPTGWVRQCIELRHMSHGWIQEPSPLHVTMLHSMTQESQVPWQSGSFVLQQG